MRRTESLVRAAYVAPQTALIVEQRPRLRESDVNRRVILPVLTEYQTPPLVPLTDASLRDLMRPESVASFLSYDKKKRFVQLKRIWKKESRHLSRMKDIVSLKPYVQIIGIGPKAVPLLMVELEQSPDWWFYALEMITGVNPVRPEHGGNLDAMAQDWLDWWYADGSKWTFRN